MKLDLEQRLSDDFLTEVMELGGCLFGMAPTLMEPDLYTSA